MSGIEERSVVIILMLDVGMFSRRVLRVFFFVFFVNPDHTVRVHKEHDEKAHDGHEEMIYFKTDNLPVCQQFPFQPGFNGYNPTSDEPISAY